MITYYNGWTIYHTQFGSQGWKADRHGVSMCANNEELLKRMIDNKNYQIQEWSRKGWGA